jgi:ATP-binding cassette subfamily B protein
MAAELGLAGDDGEALRKGLFFGSTPSLSRDAFRALREEFESVTYRFGESIVREGAPSDAVFLVVSGRARAVRRGEDGTEVSLGTIGPGELIGELSFVEGSTRTATVRASEDLHALRLERARLQRLLERYPTIRSVLELQARRRTIQNLLRRWSPLGQLPVPVLRDLVEKLERREAKPGERIISEGDPSGPMFLVEDGRLRVFSKRNGETHDLAFLREGEYFGELSLLTGAPRAATVEALTECRLFSLSPESFKTLADEHEPFRALVNERAAEYDYKRQAQIPLDFYGEIAPASALAETGVSPHQVERGPEPSPENGARPSEAPPPDEPFATGDGLFRWRGRRRVRRFPFLMQIDQMDCGVACIAMICRYYGRRVGLARIRELARTATDGTSLRSLCRAATELGIASRAVKASHRNLDQIPLPALAHWEGNHWVCLLEVRKKKVRVADPAQGDRWVPREEFDKNWSGYVGLFEPTPAFENAPEEDISPLWLVGFLKPHAGTLLQAVLLALASSGLAMLMPVFSQLVVDRVIVEGEARLLNGVLVAMVLTALLLCATSLLQRYLLAHVTLRVDASSLDFITRTLLDLPLKYFQTRRTGDIERRLDGLYYVRELAVTSGIAALVATTTVIAAVVMMVVYSPSLALVYVLVAPLYVVLTRWFVSRIRPLFQSLEEQHGRYRSHRIDAIRGMEAVKASAAEAAFREKLLERFVLLTRDQMRADLNVQGFRVGAETIGLLATAFFLWAGARRVATGELTLGALIAFTSLVALTNQPILALLSMWDRLQLAGVLLRRIADIFETEPEQGHDRSGLLAVPTLSGAVEVRNLSVRYGGPEAPPILDGISFAVPAGSVVAIVGRSGSGKTTLVRCLAGLVDAAEGSILFDGIDLRRLRHRDLRRMIGFVLQESHIFDGTILENIAFGDEPDLERAMRAAKTAAAHDFIMGLPLGYETRVGETGVLLSGGQRQRIVISRAIYRKPPIVIFDEATSALDSESERAIQESLEQRFVGTTLFVIAHRLSTVRHADQILVLDRGRIVERGTHDSLMETRGLYFYLVSQQIGA